MAEARAVEERRRRKLQLGLAAVGPGAVDRRRPGHHVLPPAAAGRAAAVGGSWPRPQYLRDQARAQAEDPARWQAALVAVRRVDDVLGTGGGAAATRRRWTRLRTEVQAGLDGAQRDRRLLDRLVDIRSAKADDPDGSATDAAYADAFGEAGMDLAACRRPTAGRRSGPGRRPRCWRWRRRWTTGRPCARSLRKDTAGAQTAERRRPGGGPGSLAPRPPRRAGSVGQVGPPGRASQAVARSARFDELGAVSLDLLGTALDNAGDPATAETVLRAGAAAASRRRLGQL